MRHVWPQESPYPGLEEVSSYPARVGVRLGIIKGLSPHHQYYAAACRDLGVPYAMVDLFRSDWIESIERCECDAFLVWPTLYSSIWKQLFDERMYTLVNELHKPLFPSFEELWFYESKRRMNYWLVANAVPHPETWVFYDREQALAFARDADLPIVFKTDLGAVSSGVEIIRERAHLVKIVRRVFGKGYYRRGSDIRDRQWGHVLLQRYIHEAREWRMIRIGDSYFGYEKLRSGEFHSGSYEWRYTRPASQLLELTRMVTEKGRFASMSVDILIDHNEQLYVNELQSVFGIVTPYACMVDGRRGRMLYDAATSEWRFEEGDFCQNWMCNLRTVALLEALGVRLAARKPSMMPEA